MKGIAGSLLLAASMSLTGVQPALAADAYPTRPIRLIVPFPPGGGTDISSTPEEFGRKIRDDMKMWANVVQASGTRPD